jgi:hypothetical protein
MLKAIKVKEEAHKTIKQFCQDRCLKIGPLVEKILLEYIKENSKDGKEV